MQTIQRTLDSSADYRRLAAVCSDNSREPALGQHLLPSDWAELLPYLQPLQVKPSQVLIGYGATDRIVYFVESGSLSVHYEDAAGRIHLAVVGPGSAVGEGSFFSHRPRNATVQAVDASRVWALTPLHFAELANHKPATALAVTLALGGLVSARTQDRRRRVSVT